MSIWSIGEQLPASCPWLQRPLYHPFDVKGGIDNNLRKKTQRIFWKWYIHRMKVYIFLKNRKLLWRNNCAKNFIRSKIFKIYTFDWVGWQTDKDPWANGITTSVSSPTSVAQELPGSSKIVALARIRPLSQNYREVYMLSTSPLTSANWVFDQACGAMRLVADRVPCLYGLIPLKPSWRQGKSDLVGRKKNNNTVAISRGVLAQWSNKNNKFKKKKQEKGAVNVVFLCSCWDGLMNGKWWVMW